MSNYPEPVSLETTTKIIEEMKKNICTITILGKEVTASGFFCKVPFPDKEHLLPVLITNNQNINRELLDEEKEILISIDNEKNPKHIKLEDRLKYSNEDYNFTLIEIKEDKDGIYNFFELDENIITQDTKKCINNSIYILQNSDKKLYVSY